MNAAADRLDDSYPHGTVDGFRRGCRGGVCPAGDAHGLSCRRASQFNAGDYRYQKLVKRGLTPAAIADELGLIPETNAAPAPKPKPARKLRPEPEETTMTTPTPAEQPATPTQSEIRAWARATGLDVNTKGTVRKDVAEAYAAAHPTGTVDLPAEVIDAAPALPPASNELREDTSWEQFSDVHGNPHPSPFTDVLDETHERIGDTPADPADANPSVGDIINPDALAAEIEATTNDPATWAPRPEWATVAVSEDVERARDLAARLEAENAILITQLESAGTALLFALQAWATANDRAATASAHAATLEHDLERATAHLLGVIASKEERLQIFASENDQLTADLAASRTRVATLEADAAQPRPRLFGRAR